MHCWHLRDLYNKYPGSSWAIWSNEFPADGCVEENPSDLETFIEENRHRLKPKVVFLSLNPSTTFPEGYSNFHSTDPVHFDYRIKEFVQDNKLEKLIGGFMTDIVAETVDPDSSNIAPTDEDLDYFLDKLNHFNRRKYHVVCFSEGAFEALQSYFGATEEEINYEIRWFSTNADQYELDVYRVWFYGNWGANQDKVPKLEEQLMYLNQRLEST